MPWLCHGLHLWLSLCLRVQLAALREGGEAEVALAAQRLAKAQADAAHASTRISGLEKELAAAGKDKEAALAQAQKQVKAVGDGTGTHTTRHRQSAAANGGGQKQSMCTDQTVLLVG